MKFLLDTNICIDLLNRPHGPVTARVAQNLPDDIGICTIVLGELLVGAFKSKFQQHNLGLIQQLTSQFECIPFDNDAALHFGQIREYLERMGKPIGPYDTQIAAVAQSRSLVLVTHNVNEFQRVPNLTIEDWLVPLP